MKKTLISLGVIVLIMPIVLVITLGGFFSAGINSLTQSCGLNLLFGPSVSLISDVTDTKIGNDGLKLTEERAKIGSMIYNVGKQTASITDEEIKLALASALGESTLQNVPYLGPELNDHWSVGPYQMQFGPETAMPDGSQYWGTYDQLIHPEYQIPRFYAEIVKKRDILQGLPPIEAMQELLVFARREMTNRSRWFDEAEILFQMFETASESQSDNTGSGRSVAVIGDSITVASNPFIFSDLAAAGYGEIRVDAQGARSVAIDTTSTYVPTTSVDKPTLTSEDQVLVSGITAIERFRENGYDPSDWIILLGTNDIGLMSDDPEQAQSQANEAIESIMSKIGNDKRVMWLTVWSASLPDRARTFNTALVDQANSRNNMLVGDWASFVEQNPDWLSDGVHYDMEGNRQRSSFIGRVTGFFGGVVDAGVDVADDVVDAAENVVTISTKVVGALNPLDAVCSTPGIVGTAIGTLTDIVDGNVDELTLVSDIANPDIAIAVQQIEEIVGGPVVYGAPRARWTSMGLKGNFGHGDKEQWFAEAISDPMSRAADCSGLANLAIYIAKKMDYSGCSHSYKNLSIDGKTMTVPIMDDSIDASLLQPGDFIIKHDKGCIDSDINHIVIVLSVTEEEGEYVITTAESAASTGFIIQEKPASWYNDNWLDLIVSRWIGPGAIDTSKEAPDSTDESLLPVSSEIMNSVGASAPEGLAAGYVLDSLRVHTGAVARILHADTNYLQKQKHISAFVSN